MKILIIGGSGFIGRNLKEQLVNDYYEVHAPTSTELNLLDISKVSQYLKEHYFDVILHAATWAATRTSTKDITRVFENNIKMFCNIVRNSRSFGRMIYYGSGADYDRSHWVPLMKEDYFGNYIPEDDYGLSKYLMTQHTLLNDKIINLRLFGVFGKYEDWEIRFISNACCKAVHNLPITIKNDAVYDYMYVDDVVKVTRWFLNNTAKENIYNVCTANPLNLTTLAAKVIKVSNKKLDIVVKGNAPLVQYNGDNTKLLSEMKSFQFSNIDVCIEQLYKWYESIKDKIDKNKLLIDK